MNLGGIQLEIRLVSSALRSRCRMAVDLVHLPPMCVDSYWSVCGYAFSGTLRRYLLAVLQIVSVCNGACYAHDL
jgi:hypothetical protein